MAPQHDFRFAPNNGRIQAGPADPVCASSRRKSTGSTTRAKAIIRCLQRLIGTLHAKELGTTEPGKFVAMMMFGLAVNLGGSKLLKTNADG
jgi:hypothetical protein